MECETSEKAGPGKYFKFGVRHLFVFLGEKRNVKLEPSLFPVSGFLGFANVYAMRVNLSVAIVYMAGEKGMAWKESQQGFILGEI